MVSSVRPVAQGPAPPRSPPGHSCALMPWLTSPRRRATPWIRQLTGGACDIGLTRPYPLDCYLPDLRCPTLRVPRCLFRKCHSLPHPLAIAWIASGKNAQIASVIQLHAPSTSAAENGVVGDPPLVDPMTDARSSVPLAASIYSVD